MVKFLEDVYQFYEKRINGEALDSLFLLPGLFIALFLLLIVAGICLFFIVTSIIWWPFVWIFRALKEEVL